jgi:hypothetical protein
LGTQSAQADRRPCAAACVPDCTGCPRRGRRCLTTQIFRTTGGFIGPFNTKKPARLPSLPCMGAWF